MRKIDVGSVESTDEAISMVTTPIIVAEKIVEEIQEQNWL
jgi:hypothetical protein